jgi:hypothetical protein
LQHESPEDKQARLNFLREHGPELHRYLAGCTIPFYARNDAQAELFGTAVLLQVADTHFAISAAHVFDKACRLTENAVPVYVATNNQKKSLLPVDGWTAHTTLPVSGKDRDNDPLDVGLMVIPQAAAEILDEGRTFVRLGICELRQPLIPEARYVVYGYPTMGSTVIPAERAISYGPQPYVTTLYKGQRGELPTASESHRYLEINVDFVPDRTTDHHGNPSTILHPGGMSGGAIWRLYSHPREMAGWSLGNVKLVGIEHTYNRQIGVLRGTQIGCVLGLIHKSFPELRPSLNFHFPQFFQRS